MDASRGFGALLEAAGLERPEDLSAALEIPIEIARHYAAQSDSPPRVVVLAVERLVDVRVAAQIATFLRGRRI